MGEGGRYALFERTGEGGYSSQGTLRVRRRPDGLYEYQTDKEPGEISFHTLDGERWVGQSKNMDGGGGYGYVILTRSDREFFLYYADCHKQDRALLAEHGVIMHEHTCSIDAVSDPSKLFARLSPGEPTFKLVPE